MNIEFNGKSTDFQFVSDGKSWNLDGRIKSLQIVPFCHTIHLSLFNDPNWNFHPRKSAKLHYTLDGTRHTLTVFPKILIRTVNEPPRRSTDTQTWTTFVLYARDCK